MSRLRFSVLLTTFLFVSGVAAQEPIFHSEHAWGFQIGGCWYGLSQWRLDGADSKNRTTVNCGSPLFTVKMPAIGLIALVVIPLASVGTFIVMQPRRRSGV